MTWLEFCLYARKLDGIRNCHIYVDEDDFVRFYGVCTSIDFSPDGKICTDDGCLSENKTPEQMKVILENLV